MVGPRALSWVLVVGGCTGAPLPPPTPMPVGVAARVSDCPDEPAVELFALREGALREAFRAGGHITALDPSRLEDDPSTWVVGELDVKGTRAFETHTHALAAETYAATTAGRAPVSMALVLRGRVVGMLEVRSAMRGGRFRVRVPDDVAFDADAVDELTAALRDDRRCFGGR